MPGTPSKAKYEICLIGSGGVGTIASLVLTKSALARVTVVLRSKYNYVSEHGWEIDSVDHGRISGWKPYRVVRSAAEAATAEGTTDWEDENSRDGEVKQVEYDYVVVATKALPSLNPVVDMISPVITPGETTVVLIQNGIGIEEDIVKTYPGNVVMSSVSHIGSEIKEPNIVVQVGKDVSKMGSHLHAGVDDATSMAKAKSFVDMYVAGGAHTCELISNIQTARWEKLLWNGTFNTVCALMLMNVGELQRSKGRETLLVPMMWEIWRIAEAAGHAMPESIVQWMAYRLPNDCAYRPSMLLDLENERPMEVDVILGNALSKAREVGVETPVLSVVYNLLVLEEWKIGQRKVGET
ncbi:ketopantoate reductase PanE/ApbA C terminal-domain-containing protein [Aspergillus keveii]|uniref:Ketopantoate reductase PanE/ApbA C terminal-domain-containing protein n=1 Tax=Aspergillus keveii TaxID=714993 RepID=A0ABR4FIX8_9EURO